jgi:cysteinyl-tRNA synthetase
LAFGAEQMEQATASCERLRNFFREQAAGGESEGDPSEQPRGGSVGSPPDSPAAKRLSGFRDALADDFNTPRAMAAVFELVGEANREETPGAREAVEEMLELLGLGSLAEVEVRGDAEAEALLAEREEARVAKDFSRADEIRDRLAELGWEVRDSADGAKLVPRERL